MTRRRMKAIFLTTCLGAALCSAALQAETISISSWTPEFQGIDYASGTLVDNGNTSVAYGLRIDLAAPGIQFTTTPPGGSLNTISETTSQFLEKTGAQAAINANFFAPCCVIGPQDKTVIGLAVSNGTLVAPPTSASQGNDAALLLSQQNQATITNTTSNMNLSGIYNAVAGSSIIVRNGVNIATPSRAPGDLNSENPRSDVGLSQNGEFLYLVAIDGRQAGYSVGTTMIETADFLIAFGAYNALNLDGGGSTVLVTANGQGGTNELNRPSGGSERYDANSLGVFAQPLVIATPEPCTLGGLGLGLGLIMIVGWRKGATSA